MSAAHVHAREIPWLFQAQCIIVLRKLPSGSFRRRKRDKGFILC